jgi:hypothetical protein
MISIEKIVKKIIGDRRIESNRRVKLVEFKKPNRRKTERREK